MKEVKCWAFGVGNVNPFMKRSRDAVKYISKLEGLVGVHPHYPDGTLIIFKTKNDAIRGMNDLRAKGIQTGFNIGEVYVEERYLK